MKKLFLSLVAAIVAATATYAQSDLVATLSHDGVTTAYYGANAFVQAYNTATHGDIISLSSGTFNSTNIEKAITIRGAGMQTNTETKTYPTVINGEININIPSDLEQRLTIEGLFLNTLCIGGELRNASFVKSRIKIVKTLSSDARMKNVLFANCKIVTSFMLPDKECTVYCMNCYVKNPVILNSRSSHFEFTNCIISSDGGDAYMGSNSYKAYLGHIQNSSFYNSIIYTSITNISGNNILSSSCSEYNCIGISANYDHILPFTVNNNALTSDIQTIFEDYTGTYTDDVTFTLTDDAKSNYKGIDGTQVGIYGGDVPFDPTPSNPQITRFDVEKSTANGKLTVKINVEQ